MRAIEVRRFGGPEVLQVVERPDPSPGAGEVVVESVASDVLFVDTMIRSGRGSDYFAMRPPYIPGNGMGGIVRATGDGVERRWLGRVVVAHTGGRGGGSGYAERAAVDVEDIVAVPEGIDALDAVGVLHDGATALRVCEVVGIRSTDRVLILGAAGGMGVLLVEFLSNRGALVLGAARGRTKMELITEAGAAAAIDYGSAGWGDDVLDATDGAGPDVVLDGVGGQIGQDAFELIAPGGRFSAHGAPSGSFAPIDPRRASQRNVALNGIRELQYPPRKRSRLIRRALSELLVGRMNPLIGQTWPLEEAASAHAAMEARESVGKSLLVVG